MDIQSVVLPVVALLAGWLVGYLAMRGPKNAERAKSEELQKELEETERREELLTSCAIIFAY